MLVEVLLSSHNGSRWLRAQLDSVLAQTHSDLHVVVRDDGSTDGTQHLLAAYASRDDRVRWEQGRNVGAAASFLRLLERSSADVDAVALCDQDDVWDVQHLEHAVAAIASVPTETPMLWCSDVLVCSEDLVPLRRHDQVRRQPSFRNALVQNVVTGCTAVLNRAAVDVVRGARPSQVVMHDAWCYLVVAATGEVVYDPRPSVHYRQHAANTVGLARGRLASAGARVRRAATGPHVGAWTRQAEELRRLHAEDLSQEVRAELSAFLAGRTSSGARLRYALAGSARRQTLAGTVAARVLYLAGRL